MDQEGTRTDELDSPDEDSRDQMIDDWSDATGNRELERVELLIEQVYQRAGIDFPEADDLDVLT